MNSLSNLAAKALFDRIDQLEPEFQALLRQMVAIESHSMDREGVNQVGKCIASFASQKGFDVSWHPFTKAGDGLVISAAGQEGKKPACFTAHMDTVHKKGSFPKMLHPEGEFLYGPGIVDCKGGIAVALLAMTALRQMDGGCRPLKLVLTPDEEVSNRLSGNEGVNFIRSEARGCIAAITCECGATGEAVVERKGILKVDVTVSGKAAHAGMHYDKGVSAIREAAHKILELESHSDIHHITYNCGLIQGGRTYNIIPDHCVFGVDIRFRTNSEREEAVRFLKEVVQHSYEPGISSRAEILSERPPMEKSQGGMDLFSLLQQTGERFGLEELRPCPNGGGSDAAYTAMEVPSICGMGMTGFEWHTPEERAELASLKRRAKLLAAAVAQMEE